MCADAVLSGEGSVDDAGARYNISSREVLRRWIMSYNANRELKEYNPKSEVYMAGAGRKTAIEECREIVAYCLGHNHDYKGTADIYEVSCSQVYSWVKKSKSTANVSAISWAAGEWHHGSIILTIPHTVKTGSIGS